MIDAETDEELVVWNMYTKTCMFKYFEYLPKHFAPASLRKAFQEVD